VLEFIDTADMTVMAQGEHFMATDVEWDPTGRYLTTSVSWWGHKVDNAFWVWNFQGRILYKQQMERFCQFLWRPQQASLLSAQQVKVRSWLGLDLFTYTSSAGIVRHKSDLFINKHANIVNNICLYVCLNHQLLDFVVAL